MHKQLKNILISFFASLFVFVVLVYLWIFGVTETMLFSDRALISYIFVIVAFATGALVFLDVRNKIFKAILYCLLIFSLLLLILLDSLTVWILLLIVAFTSSYLLDDQKKGRIPKLYLYISIIAIFFSFLQANDFINSFRKFVNPSNDSAAASIFDKISFLSFNNNSFGFIDSFKISKGALKENWFIGSGQGTFPYNVSKYGGQAAGYESPRAIRLNNPSNYLFTLAANTGLLGVLSYSGLIIFFFIIFYHVTCDKMKQNDEQHKKSSFILINIICVVLALLFLLPNMFLIFIFWVSLAIMMLELKKIFPQFFSDKSISMDGQYKQENKMNIYPLANLLFVVIIIVLSGFYTIVFRYRIADRNYKEYLINSAQASGKLEEAIRLNRHFEDYALKLAERSLEKISFELAKEKEEDKELNVLGEESARSIEITKRNVEEHPNSVRAWETAGNVYKNVSPFVKKGAEEWIIKSFENALELEPHNFFFKLEIGKAYLLEGTVDGVDNEKLSKSIDFLNSVIDGCANNKCDYYTEAKFYLAKALEAKGKDKQAIAELQDINVNNQPFIEKDDAKVLFELGRIYFNNGELDKAVRVLEEVLRISPNNSNALYTLAAVYEKQLKIEQAISLLEKVLELNSGNSDIQEKIESLKKIK